MTPTFAAVFFVIASFGATQQQGQGQAQGQQQQPGQRQGQGQQVQGQQGQGRQGQGRQGQSQQGQARQGQNVQGQLGQQGQGRQGQNLQSPGLRISTPTYFSDGKILGASAVRSGEFTVYPHSGGTLCESSSAAQDMPTDAGFGWRVTMTTRGLDTTLTPRGSNTSSSAVDVTWQRLWNNGKKVNEPAHGPVSLNLSSGSRVVLDYLAATPTTECPAIGMALEIGLESAQTSSVLQTDLWLVYQPDGQPARSQRQTVRLAENGSATYYFDDVAIDSGITIRYFGTLSKVVVKDGEVTMDLAIAQSAAGRDRGGSTTYPVRAKLGDTIAFKLPNPMAQFFFFNEASKTTTTNVPASGTMSLLLRAEQIR